MATVDLVAVPFNYQPCLPDAHTAADTIDTAALANVWGGVVRYAALRCEI